MASAEDVSTPNKNKEPHSWVREPPKHSFVSPRDSMASMLSGESYSPSEIGKAVELSVVEEQRGHTGPVKQTYVQGQSAAQAGGGESFAEIGPAEDEDSVFSSSTVHLGRLDTIKSSTKPNSPPAITVNTAIDSVIPPRSRRRPVSEIIPSAERSPDRSGHRHRFSLNISDDLDKLMASASGLTEARSGSSSRVPSGPVPRVERSPTRSTNTSVSKDSFQTADEESDERTETPFVLPKRPNAQNMSRAREVSESHAQKHVRQDRNVHGDVASTYSSDAVSTRTWGDDSVDSQQTPTGPRTPNAKTSKSEGAPGAQYPEDLARSAVPHQHSGGPVEISRHDVGAGSVRSAQSWTKSNASGYSQQEPEQYRYPGHEHDMEASTSGQRSAIPGHPSGVQSNSPARSPLTPQNPTETQENTQPVHPLSGETSRNLHSPVLAQEVPRDATQEAQITGKGHATHPNLPENPNLAENPVDDEGFYDIDEPVVVSHPARAKSVKDNTRNPPRKGSKRRTRRGKAKDSDAGTHLKPFSYDTLVHLLESMNGTVIGEEFQTLNLPIQEKQLIEKVIDSLSRLTSDMVTDKHRFDVGIERLEKAHRVLEGFL